MKTIRFLVLALGFHFGHAALAEMVLVEKGASLAPVIVPENPTMFTRLAAQELADYLGRIGGAKVAVIEGAPATTPDSAIWVGLQPKVRSHFPGTDFDFQHPGEILIKCDGKNLAIVGRDVWDPITNKRKIIAGQTEAERKDYLASGGSDCQEPAPDRLQRRGQ